MHLHVHTKKVLTAARSTLQNVQVQADSKNTLTLGVLASIRRCMLLAELAAVSDILDYLDSVPVLQWIADLATTWTCKGMTVDARTTRP